MSDMLMLTHDNFNELQYLLRCSNLGFKSGNGEMCYMNERWYVCFDNKDGLYFSNFHDAVVHLMNPSWIKNNGHEYQKEN